MFSAYRNLVGHYPFAGRLRVACSFSMRKAEEVKWEDKAGKRTDAMIKYILKRVQRKTL